MILNQWINQKHICQEIFKLVPMLDALVLYCFLCLFFFFTYKCGLQKCEWKRSLIRVKSKLIYCYNDKLINKVNLKLNDTRCESMLWGLIAQHTISSIQFWIQERNTRIYNSSTKFFVFIYQLNIYWINFGIVTLIKLKKSQPPTL